MPLTENELEARWLLLSRLDLKVGEQAAQLITRSLSELSAADDGEGGKITSQFKAPAVAYTEEKPGAQH